MSFLEMSVSASCFILAVVCFRFLLLNKVPKMTFIVLWGVALSRLLIPVSVYSQFSIFTAVNNITTLFTDQTSISLTQNTPISHGGTVTTPLTADNLITPNVPMEPSSSIWIFLLAWLIGFTIFALFFIIPHIRCRKNYRTSLPLENEFIQKWQKSNPLWRKVRIRQSDTIINPLTYGIFQPVILMPKHIDYTDEDQLKLILIHEYIHVKRFDTLKKWVLAASLCVHWFNPFVWLMYIMANRDIELSCDEKVIRTSGESMKSSYAMALVRLEEKKSGMFQMASHFSKISIEERIISIMKTKKISRAAILLAIVIVVGTVTVFATSASGKPEAAPGNASGVESNHTEAKLSDFRGDFRNATWGMSTNEFRKTEAENPNGHGENIRKAESSLHYDGNIHNLKAGFGTTFIDDKLVEARYGIFEQHSNATEHINDFNNLKKNLTEKYGTPITDDITWKNDLYKDDPSDWGTAVITGNLVYETVWETDTTHILLKLHGRDNQPFLGIFYSSKDHVEF
ncbi:M56 family metallopeptidase [Cohnella herbarum]|uniref:M56 family metallopeptidase n=1 Tax=Cohnella herbarum TaxID=2728023 RepID=A0A7Z2VH67_9BACL|nr:M56 family metallopeptidase [Cohnella herbarum]QJD82814.1 M56 family metallopeptidase [Cohnella herbarum]